MLKLEVHTEALIAEASKDRKLREQSEHYSKQLENELEGLKVLLVFIKLLLHKLSKECCLLLFGEEWTLPMLAVQYS